MNGDGVMENGKDKDSAAGSVWLRAAAAAPEQKLLGPSRSEVGNGKETSVREFGGGEPESCKKGWVSSERGFYKYTNSKRRTWENLLCWMQREAQ